MAAFKTTDARVVPRPFIYSHLELWCYQTLYRGHQYYTDRHIGHSSVCLAQGSLAFLKHNAENTLHGRNVLEDNFIPSLIDWHWTYKQTIWLTWHEYRDKFRIEIATLLSHNWSIIVRQTFWWRKNTLMSQIYLTITWNWYMCACCPRSHQSPQNAGLT